MPLPLVLPLLAQLEAIIRTDCTSMRGPFAADALALLLGLLAVDDDPDVVPPAAPLVVPLVLPPLVVPVLRPDVLLAPAPLVPELEADASRPVISTW